MGVEIIVSGWLCVCVCQYSPCKDNQNCLAFRIFSIFPIILLHNELSAKICCFRIVFILLCSLWIAVAFCCERVQY